MTRGKTARARRAAHATTPEPTPSLTVDQLAALDLAVQRAQDRRHVAHLTVTGAHVPDVDVRPLYPGVPAGAMFCAVAANPELAEAFAVMGVDR